MRILIDECVPLRVRDALREYQVRTVAQMRWAGLSNGKLIAAIEGHFDLWITSDQNIPKQRNLQKCSFGVIVLPSNDMAELEPLMGKLRIAVKRIGRGQVVKIHDKS